MKLGPPVSSYYFQGRCGTRTCLSVRLYPLYYVAPTVMFFHRPILTLTLNLCPNPSLCTSISSSRGFLWNQAVDVKFCGQVLYPGTYLNHRSTHHHFRAPSTTHWTWCSRIRSEGRATLHSTYFSSHVHWGTSAGEESLWSISLPLTCSSSCSLLEAVNYTYNSTA